MKALIALLLTIFGIAALTSFATAAGTVNYSYLIGTGFLCGLDSSACPDIAMAGNGDTVEITGSGTFSIHPKSVSGGGTFVHKDSSGNVIGSGTWTATELISFHSYGSGSAQGLPAVTEGGLALIRVHLVSTTGIELDAVLQVDCTLGDKIPGGAKEGVRLALQGLDFNFNKEVSGFTVFIRD